MAMAALTRRISRQGLRAAMVAGLAGVLFVAGGLGLLTTTGGGSRAAPAIRAKAPVAPDPVIPGASLASVIESLQARLRAFPKDAGAYASLGLAYVQQARMTADPSLYPKAEAVLDRSMALQPSGNVPAMTGMASLAAARHDFHGSLSWGRQAEAVDPFNANAHLVVGDALVELGRYDQAFAEFQRGVDLRPDLSSYARASYAWELQGNTPNAVRALGLGLQAAASPSDAAWASNQMGDLSFNRGDLRGAERSYRRAVAFDPTFVPPRAGLAKVEAARGSLARAIRDYAWVVQRFPLPEYVIALGDLYRISGGPGLAERQYELVRAEEELFRAAGVNVDLEIALFDADHATDLAGGLAAARAEWARRQSVQVADVLAWSLYAKGRYREALGYANRALRLGTRSALFHFHRGMIERQLGEADSARADLSLALRINPHFSMLWAGPAAAVLASLGGSV